MELITDPVKEQEQIIRFLQDTFQKTKHKKAVIACSGGIDSSVAATLLVKAMGAENVSVALLPYKDLYPQGLELGKIMIEFLQLPKKNVSIIDIAPEVDSFARILEVHKENDKIRFGNIMARVRMVLLYDFAKKREALVCGTENKSEHYLGYFTRFGDEASDVEPIRHLYKTQVYQLGEYCMLPQEVITQSPTAGHFTALGACSSVSLAYYDLAAKTYIDKAFDEDLEITGIVGNIALLDNKPIIHTHGTFSNKAMQVFGGHIQKLIVSATCEVHLTILSGTMKRGFDKETGLNLLQSKQ